MATRQLEQRVWTCRQTVDCCCNLCGLDESEDLAVENGLNVVRCKACGLVFVKPRPTGQELHQFYQQYFRPEVSDDWRKATGKLFIRDAKRISHHLAPGKIFDIGCGFGFFLKLMQDAGWEVHGCDYSRIAVDYARTHLELTNVHWGPFQTVTCPPGFFDAVTAWYVLHHVAEPGAVLERIHTALKPGGLVALRVPSVDLFKLLWIIKKFDCPPVRFLLQQIRKETSNPQAVYNALDPPLQLYGFNPRVLRSFLERKGFEVLSVHNDGMVERGNLFNRLVDAAVTLGADVCKQITGGRLDLSISFSIYAKKL